MNDEQLETLGAEARRVQDAALATRPLPPLVLQRPSSRPVWVSVAVAAAIGAAVVTGLQSRLPDHAPEQVASSTSPSSSPSSSPAQSSSSPPSLPSWVSPEPGARVTTTSTAWVALDAGAVSLLGQVPGTAGPAPVLDVGAWRVEPQPGARAVVRWDPAQLAFAVDVAEGDVRVRGAGIVGERTLHAGEQLTLSPREQPSSVSASSSSASSASSGPRAAQVAHNARPAAEPVDAVAPAEAVEVVEVEPVEPVAPTAVTTTWQELARANRYTDAVAAARREGLEAIFANASAEDLQLLGDSARFSLDVELASSSFTSVRRRFVGTLLGARACFYLARIASDARRDDAEAAALLREYLDAAPNDVLSQEASGRLVEVLERSGRRAEARDAAAVYLRRWPQGPHAELCRSVDRGAPR